MNVLNVINARKPFLVHEIERLEKNGIKMDIVEIPGDHHVNFLDEAGRTPLDYIRSYPEILKKSFKPYDIIHAHYGLTAPLALAQPNCPVVLSLWGSDLVGWVGQVTKRCAKYCDENIVMSDKMERQLGADAHVIPHGINMEQFRPMGQQAAQNAVGWDSTMKHILFPYDPSRTVKDYPLAESIVNETSKCLQDAVELHAVYEADHEDIPLYMNAADALLLTSRREGFPNAVKEALACNLPVVSTDVGGLRNRLEPIDNSYVCRDEEGLLNRLTEVLASGQRSNGREHVADLSLDRMADEIIGIYRSALE